MAKSYVEILDEDGIGWLFLKEQHEDLYPILDKLDTSAELKPLRLFRDMILDGTIYAPSLSLDEAAARVEAVRKKIEEVSQIAAIAGEVSIIELRQIDDRFEHALAAWSLLRTLQEKLRA